MIINKSVRTSNNKKLNQLLHRKVEKYKQILLKEK